MIQKIGDAQYDEDDDDIYADMNGISSDNVYLDSGVGEIYTYDAQNHLVKAVSGNEITRYVYNGGDKLLQVIYPNQYNAEKDNLNLTAETPVDTYTDLTVGDHYTYNDSGNVLTYTNRYGDVTTNTYDSDGSLISTSKSDGTVFEFDNNERVKKETYKNGLIRNYTYNTNQTVVSGSNGITVTSILNSFGEVAEYRFKNGENTKSYSYTYDSNGNITAIALNGTLQQSFTYNSSNELIRVDDSVANKSVTYDYDFVGNITAVKTYAYTTGSLGTATSVKSYTYNSQNQRTDLSYDANGNLTSLNGYNFTWNGRRLATAISSNSSISYTYNNDGIRTSKTVNGTTTYYVVDENNNVVKQYELVNGTQTNVIEFVYDSDNSPIYFTYNNATYYYEKNMQGDIVGILDTSGNTVVKYSYDIWGKLLSTTGMLLGTVGVINPLRYRGYYYDTETALYYLQSRYYSPELMRFISRDDPALSNAQGEPLGSNLYAYCFNNPVMNSDPTGHWLIQAICGVAGAAIFGTVANILCRLLCVSAKVRKLVTAGFALLGGILGAAFGPTIVGKIAPKTLKWVNSLEKIINSKSKFRPIIFEGQTIIGFEYNNFKIMIHPTHRKEPQKGWHIAIQHKTLSGRWRQTIPDIPLKKLSNRFMSWAKKWLK